MAKVNPKVETFAKIKVIGIGGSGCNATSHMVRSSVSGVDFVAVNTDAQALHAAAAPEKIHIGKNLTRGLGSGMNPEIGRQAAEENKDEILDVIKGVDMIFLTCGMGGGTGTGAIPIIAEAARDVGALTIAVVNRPFAFEGNKRREIAEAGLEELRDRVDALITVPNDRLLGIIDKKTSLLDSFVIVNDILRQGVQGISDLITMPGLVNVDFADVRTIMKETGSAIMGIGKSSGENRAAEAAKQAINNPMLEMSIDGARGILFNVTGGADIGMQEINEAAEVINESIDPDAKIIFGAVVNEEAVNKGEIKITVIATGFGDGSAAFGDIPTVRTSAQVVSDVVKKTKDDDLDDNSQPDERQQPVRKIVSVTPKKKIRKDDDDNQQEEESKTQEVKQMSAAVVDSGSPEPDEEDLDIPAFIRRKMK